MLLHILEIQPQKVKIFHIFVLFHVSTLETGSSLLGFVLLTLIAFIDLPKSRTVEMRSCSYRKNCKRNMDPHRRGGSALVCSKKSL